MVNTRASNATKRPGLILVSPKEKRRTREEMQAVRAEKEAANATKQAAENANDILRQEAKLQLAEMEVMEEERAQEESKRSRRRRRRLTDTETEQHPKKKQKGVERANVAGEVTDSDNESQSKSKNKSRALTRQGAYPDLGILMNFDDDDKGPKQVVSGVGKTKKVTKTGYEASDEEMSDENGPVFEKHDERVTPHEDPDSETEETLTPKHIQASRHSEVKKAGAGVPVTELSNTNPDSDADMDEEEEPEDDIVAQSLDDEQTPRANQRQTEGRAPGKINSKHDASKTGKEVVPASVDNEAKPESGRVKQPLVPSSDNDMPVENAKKPKPRPKGHGAKQVTATGAKGQATFTTYDANATTALKGRSEKQKEIVTSDMEMDGGEKINDPKTPAKRGRKIGEPQAASKTKSKGAAQKAPGEKANRPEVNILDSEISIDESPVKAKKKRSKPSAEEAKKEMEGLKKQVKEAKTKKRADEADLNKSATSAPHKLLESVLSRLLPPSVSMKFCFFHSLRHEPDIPSFEEDQEVEHQAMLSSPLKGRQRITSKTLVTVKARQTGKAKEAVNVKNVPSGKPHSNQNASGSKFNAKKEPGSAEETADDLDDTSNAKSNTKVRTRPTNGSSLPPFIRSDSAFWKITILSAYRTHIACTKEIWTVQNTTSLRYLQTIWDFFAKDKQAYTFVPTDPIFSLLRQKMSDWRHKFADTALQALRSFLDEKEESEEESRQLVTELLVKKYYIYAEFDEDENGVISAVRPFCSQLVSQTFARHLIEINGKNYELPNLQPPDKPIAALALAAAAVERALTLYRDRHLVPCFKGGLIIGLNTTDFFVRHLDLLPQSKWNKISNAAKVYLPQPCAARQARKGKAPIDEVEEDLQLNWRDDDD
ncbi:hypothetical protein JOM56_000068 [Amanita muscaria]